MPADVIIVGGGTAGCVLAARLSESSRRQVLLLEAGERPTSPFVRIPAGFAKLFGTRFDWAFESEPQAAADGRRIFTPRGRMLGGSANLNAQIHQWCHPADFDGWAAAGAGGWDWKTVAPVFRAQETSSPGSAGRGRSGPMRVEPVRMPHRTTGGFVAAVHGVGSVGPADYNGGGDYGGAWISQIAHHAGQRFSVYDAYLVPAMRRKNLTVVTGARVDSILIERGRAVGVTYSRGGDTLEVRADKIVLAAGAIATPKLMMLSGIGPGEALRASGIAVKADLPGVGQGLQDHPMTVTVHAARKADTFKSAESPLNLLKYLMARRGPLASNAVEAIAFGRSRPDLSAPDIELLYAPFEWREEGRAAPRVHALTIAPAVVAPKSRGHIALAGPDPGAAPRIDFALLQHEDDRAAMVAAIRLARRVAAHPAFARHIRGELTPGEKRQSDDDLLAATAASLQTVYHPVGSCRMGAFEDPMAVAGPDLAVRKLSGLWIADASVMPTIPRGHPNAAVAMIGHRAADWIAAA